MPETAVDEDNAHKYAALCAKMFLKTPVAREVLQLEIKIQELNMRRPYMRFDSADKRKLPVYTVIMTSTLSRKDNKHQRIQCQDFTIVELISFHYTTSPKSS
jgi:hypothetical protein